MASVRTLRTYTQMNMNNLLEITQSWTDSRNEAYKRVFIMDDKGRGNIAVEPYKDYDGKRMGYIANLCERRISEAGLAKRLLQRAEDIAKAYNCEYTVLDWTLRNSPYWVFDWYERSGYKEKETGDGCARMVKSLTPTFDDILNDNKDVLQRLKNS